MMRIVRRADDLGSMFTAKLGLEEDGGLSLGLRRRIIHRSLFSSLIYFFLINTHVFRSIVSLVTCSLIINSSVLFFSVEIMIVRGPQLDIISDSQILSFTLTLWKHQSSSYQKYQLIAVTTSNAI